MSEEILRNLLTSMEEEKVSAFIDTLSDDQAAIITKLFSNESEKTAEDTSEVEKIASDWKAAGMLFGEGFIEACNSAQKQEE